VSRWPVELVTTPGQIGVGADEQHLESRSLEKFVNESCRTCDERGVEVDFGREHPRVIVRPEDARRLCPSDLINPRRALGPGNIREAIRTRREE